MSRIRKYFGLAPKNATATDQSQAETANALKDLTDSVQSSKRTSKVLLESHRELRQAVNSFEPFIQAERLMKDGAARLKGAKIHQ